MRSKLAWLAALLATSILSAQTVRYDLLIAGGKIVDGTGGSWYYGDVGIRGDTIVAIGKLDRAAASRVLDAQALVVAPGFIDPHTHARRGIFDDPYAKNYIWQGVTTLMEGPDGSSPLPIREFLDKVAAAHPAPNFGAFAGQGTIREQVMGLVNRPATAAEIDKMRQITRQAMLDGAFGLSTGLFYVPGNYTPTEEVIELAKVAGSMGGMHTSHMRDETSHVLDSVRETIRIGEDGGLPTQITHHKIIGSENWGLSKETLRLVEEARRRGVDATIDAYPYTASSTGTAALIPQWAQEGGQKALVERLDAPQQRARIKAIVIENLKTARGGGDPANVVMANCAFDPKLAGKNLSEITRERGREVNFENAAETLFEIQHAGGCQAVYHAISEEDVERILRYPFTMIGSDGEVPHFGQGAPHPRSYGTFARVLGRYVRERQTLSLEDAVHRMSGLTAARLKLFDRGLLRPGMKADIVIFDPTIVADTATFEKPHQYAIGFRDVLVNGKAVIAEGKLTMERPGQVLYGPARQP
ncbi:MAG: N-acyl-D-amino-acid deacylase [Terriglobia bacterium]|nr:MAG: N-acyl-D-amino-acid deacylase [Terriglobia bacterium]